MWALPADYAGLTGKVCCLTKTIGTYARRHDLGVLGHIAGGAEDTHNINIAIAKTAGAGIAHL
jgi:hypothetical protein